MSQIRLIRVFLSSPGDVTEERQIALQVIERLPNRPAFREKVAFRVIAWDKPGADTPMRATLTPQEAINQGLPRPSECDIVVVLFWSRMGTPFTHTDGKGYQSGTHWELLDALNTPRPDTVIYRRTEKKLFESDDREGQEQSERVKTFFQSTLFFKDGQIVRGVNAYSAPEDFREKFETHFEELVVNILANENTNPTPQPPPRIQGGGARKEVEMSESPNVVTFEAAEWPEGKSPFPGLRALREEDALIFFGRGRETDELVRQVAKSRFVAVVGASGSGKSSLVGAGLIPRLRANAISGENVGSKDWLIARFTPGTVANPFEALAAALMETIPALASQNSRTYAQEVENFAKSLQERPDRLVMTLEHALKNEKAWVEALLFIDQFEELFTLARTPYVAPFAAMLAEAVKSPRVRVVATMRADFYHRAVPYEELATLLREGSFPLAAPKRDALREMIVRPAERAGLAFEDGLVEKILDDTGDEPGNLALMAYLLDELVWGTGVGPGYIVPLQIAAYDALGGVQGAIGKRAEAIFATLDFEAQNALAPVFRELVEVDERGEPTRRRAALSDVARDAAAEKLVTTLTAEGARLLVQDKDAEGRPTIEVSHEALLRQWPRLAAWIEGEQENLRLRRQIQQAAQEWDQNKRVESYLLRGGRLTDAEDWLDAFPAGELERNFIELSVNAEMRRIAEDYKIARRVQNFQRVTAGLAIVFALALIATIVAALTARDAQVQGDVARTQIAEQAVIAPAATNAVLIAPAATFSKQVINHYIVPTIRKFDGVEMVQVPVGCFLMGSDTYADERPIHEQCFYVPFWIDRYEVTNSQFEHWRGQAGGLSLGCDFSNNGVPRDWKGIFCDRGPRENINWFEARDFCALRGASLPTEAEWEYAARGPENFNYPWGDEWDAINLIDPNGILLPGSVGSKTEDVSWVGAHDMGGSVREWVSSAYMDYPYNTNDGREDLTEIDVKHVIKGGYFDSGINDTRSAYRSDYDPNTYMSINGFRCAWS